MVGGRWSTVPRAMVLVIGVAVSAWAAGETVFPVLHHGTVEPQVGPCWSDGTVFEAGGLTFFVRGGEPWRSDGTATGTFLLKELCPGLCHTGLFGFAELGGAVYFLAGGSAAGLWRTDGTTAGTELVAAVAPAPAAPGAPSLVAWNDSLLFWGTGGGKQRLWRSDGTTSGTVSLMASIVAWEAVAASANGFYFALSGAHELWRTDGTEAGTIKVRDARQSPQPVLPRLLVPLGGSVLYFKTPAFRSPELWRSDGTPAGTVLVRSWTGMEAEWLVASGEAAMLSVYDFPGSRRVYRTDGTAKGTLQVTSSATTGGWEKTEAVAVGGMVYFPQVESSRGAVTLWVSDGSAAGTHSLDDWTAGWTRLASVGGARVLLYVTDRENGNGLAVMLWGSDGTPEGTLPLVEISSPARFDFAAGFTRLGDDMVAVLGTSGRVVRTDGTPGGTSLIETGRDGPLAAPAEGQSLLPRAGEAVLYLAGPRWDGCAIWRTDGTSSGTYALGDLLAVGGSQIGSMRELQGSLLFQPGTSPTSPLWVSDGTVAGTRVLDLPPEMRFTASGSRVFACLSDLYRVTDLHLMSLLHRFPLNSGATCSSAVPFRGGLFFTGYDPLHGAEPWLTDGTPAGTRSLVDMAPGEPSSPVTSAIEFSDGLLFHASGPPPGLWRTDGTPEGTVFRTSLKGQFSVPVAVGDRVFFSGGGGLSVTDGTEGGTVALPVPPVRELHAAVDRVFGLAWADLVTSGFARIYASDGTPAGSGLLAQWPAVAWEFVDPELTVVDATLFFPFDDGIHGRELWSSDGTVAGTRLVRDIWAGPPGSGTQYLAAAGGHLYFAASDGDAGHELWRSDGTNEGTVMVADICPGSCPSLPRLLTAVGNTVYFDADDGSTGRQLWAARLPAPNADVVDASAASAPWAETVARVEVALSEPPAGAAVVRFETADGSALVGRDYRRTAGELVFEPDGELRQVIEVPLVPTGSGGSFFVHLTAAQGAVIRRSFGEVRVTAFGGPPPRVRTRVGTGHS